MKVEYTRSKGKCLTYIVKASAHGYTVSIGAKLLKTVVADPGSARGGRLWPGEIVKINVASAKQDIEQLRGMNEE
jgi:hypothetical protein